MDDDDTSDEGPEPVFTRLDVYPATTVGHLKFLEWVYLEVKEQAEALHNAKYSHSSIEKQLKHGVCWEEAGIRVAALRSLPAHLVEGAARLFRRELTIGTVEQMARRLGPVIEALRDAWEDSVSPLAQAIVHADREQAARRTAADREIAEIQRRDALDVAWRKIYVFMPSVHEDQGIDYKRWSENLAAFCELLAREVATQLFLDAKPTGSNETVALSLIKAGIEGGKSAIDQRLCELSTESDRSWMQVFNQLSLFWRALEPHRAQVSANMASDSPSVRLESANFPATGTAAVVTSDARASSATELTNSTVDGPEEPCYFCWRGKRIVLSAKMWAVVKYLWGCRNRSSDNDALSVAVWDDEEAASGPLRAVRTKLNRLFLREEMPFELSVSKGFTTLTCTAAKSEK